MSSHPINVAVLDDYQGVATSIVDWSSVSERANVTVFRDHLADQDAVADRLSPFDVVCIMRERTPMPASLLNRLPKLKLIASTGARNASIDLAAAAQRPEYRREWTDRCSGVCIDEADGSTDKHLTGSSGCREGALGCDRQASDCRRCHRRIRRRASAKAPSLSIGTQPACHASYRVRYARPLRALLSRQRHQHRKLA